MLEAGACNSVLNNGRNTTTAVKAKPSPGRDLRKLRRIDLLELLIDQIRENDEKAKRIEELNALIDHLKDRLDEKDVRIELLLKNVDDRDSRIESLSKRNRALAHAQGMLDAEEILEISDIAVDLYLTRISGGTVRPVGMSSQHEFKKPSDHAPKLDVVEQPDCLVMPSSADVSPDELAASPQELELRSDVESQVNRECGPGSEVESVPEPEPKPQKQSGHAKRAGRSVADLGVRRPFAIISDAGETPGFGTLVGR